MRIKTGLIFVPVQKHHHSLLSVLPRCLQPTLCVFFYYGFPIKYLRRMLSHYASGNEGPMRAMGGLQSKPIDASWYPVTVKT